MTEPTTPPPEMLQPDEGGDLVTANQKLAYWLAARFHARHPNLDLEDVQQEALMALVKAAEQFDPESGSKFGSYAAMSIKNTLGIMAWRRRIRGEPLGRIDLDAPVGGDDEGDSEEWHSSVSSEEEHPSVAIDRERDMTQLRAGLNKLDSKTHKAVKAWMNGATYDEISKKMHMSRMGAHKLVQRGLDELRRSVRESVDLLVDALLEG